MISEAEYKKVHGEGLKILTLEQMPQRLLIALAQAKAGKIYLKSCQMKSVQSYILFIEQKKLLKKYMTIS